jgi:hypothetical protein
LKRRSDGSAGCKGVGITVVLLDKLDESPGRDAFLATLTLSETISSFPPFVETTGSSFLEEETDFA